MSRQRNGRAPGPLSVLLVDDHPMWRDTVRKVIEHKKVGKVVGQAADGLSAVEVAFDLRPDVIVMDLELPGIDGIEATRRILGAIPGTKVLVLSASDARSRVLRAIEAGASGYLLKTAPSDEVADAVERIGHGEVVLPHGLAEIVLNEFRRGAARSGPVPRVLVAAPALLRREGLAKVLGDAGFEVLGSSPFADVERLVATSTPDVVVLDTGGALDAEGVTGLRDRFPGVAVLVLADEPKVSDALAMIAGDAGGFGYLLADRVSDLEELGEAVRRVARGEPVVDSDVVRGLVRGERGPLDELTASERSVLALMAEGRSNQAVAEGLHLSPKTVESRVASIFSKLGLEPAPDDHRRVLAVLAFLRNAKV